MKPICGVSACLLGQRVRYDGQHKTILDLQTVLGPHVELVPICPEFEAGLGVPRPAMGWVEVKGQERLVTELGHDVTDQLQSWTRGFTAPVWDAMVLKLRSPSCGRGRLPLKRADGSSAWTQNGIWVRHLQQNFPHLVLFDEEGWLDMPRRTAFIQALFKAASQRLGVKLLIPPEISETINVSLN